MNYGISARSAACPHRNNYPVTHGMFTGTGVLSMDAYVCSICGHLYEPEKGEPGRDIPAGTAFQNLPSGWNCRVCGAEKTLFRMN